MSKTYTVELTFEVKMTSPGHPGRGPSFSSPGDPPEPPEFEIETIFIDGMATSVEKLYAVYKANIKNPTSFDQFYADTIYCRVLDAAAEDAWDDERDSYDPTVD